MNISHLIDKNVNVIHLTKNGITSKLSGRLMKTIDMTGSYIVFGESFLMTLIKRIFSPNYTENLIIFHWSSVCAFDGNTIIIGDMKHILP
jgi:hypothetical protein